MKQKPIITILIPVYNEEKTIIQILKRIKKINLNCEIIVINDGSNDKTLELLSSNKKLYDTLITNSINMGKGYSLKRGFSISKGDIIVFQDADLEYYPEEIYNLIKPIIEGDADVVYGSRFLKKVRMKSFPRLVANKLINFTVYLLYGKQITDEATGYKVFKRSVLEKLNLFYDGFEMECELTTKVFKNNFKYMEIPISYTPRKVEESKIHWTDAIYAFWVLIKERFKK